jgi:hypothetical protein
MAKPGQAASTKADGTGFDPFHDALAYQVFDAATIRHPRFVCIHNLHTRGTEFEDMRAYVGFILLAATFMGSAAATHGQNCVPGQADPSTVIVIDHPVTGQKFYWEETGNPLGTNPPIPGTGYLLGGGTWMYEESNTVPGLQRGFISLFCEPFPGEPLPPLWSACNSPMDKSCGHGPDTMILGFGPP